MSKTALSLFLGLALATIFVLTHFVTNDSPSEPIGYLSPD